MRNIRDKVWKFPVQKWKKKMKWNNHFLFVNHSLCQYIYLLEWLINFSILLKKLWIFILKMVSHCGYYFFIINKFLSTQIEFHFWKKRTILLVLKKWSPRCQTILKPKNQNIFYYRKIVIEKLIHRTRNKEWLYYKVKITVSFYYLFYFLGLKLFVLIA